MTPHDPRLSRHTAYLKGEPKALGTVQIMIGITTLLFGIVLCFFGLTPAIVSGITLWGPLMFLTSGALSVAAANRYNSCVVKASLVMNVFSAVAAGIALVLLVVDMIIMPWHYGYLYNHYEYGYYSLHAMGIYGVLFVFSLLEFIISICTAAFACKATGCTGATVMYAQPMYAQPMYAQPMNAQPMYAQPMNAQPMTAQAMTAEQMTAQPMYNPAFYDPQVPQQSSVNPYKNV